MSITYLFSFRAKHKNDIKKILVYFRYFAKKIEAQVKKWFSWKKTVKLINFTDHRILRYVQNTKRSTWNFLQNYETHSSVEEKNERK